MIFNAISIIAAVLAMSPTAVSAPTNQTKPGAQLSKAARLRMADRHRYSILADDKDFVFDLGQNGFQSIANRQTFPAMVGTGTSIAAAKFPGCSISKLHIHPRAAEMLVVLSGRLVTETIPELGAVGADGQTQKQRVIRNELAPNTLTVFDQGALHTQINPECDDATALTVFSAEDGGFGFVADQAFALPDDVIATQLGDAISGADIDRIRAALPAGVAAQIDACVKRCKIEKRHL
ncbi:hypothetical protein MY10362_004904 [Beauveria mimosiformis]